MTHTLPALPYSTDALAPWISAETFSYHHGKHHNAYVTNLNKLIEGTEFATMSLEDIIRKSDGGVFNNAAQHFNHSFYWKCLAPAGAAGPGAKATAAINKAFGSFDAFKTEFSNAAATLFGSGWAFLVQKKDGSLAITKEPNAGCPIKSGDTPLLTCDVWEHAYYIDHRNARPGYIEGFWKHVNWAFVEANMK
ncbi:MAG: superoxide dismutase [Fe] [Planctomycetes bacterium]|nr:superoxide dismutase [Fe] [Planctomycetota bacterium]MCB9911015.1 superoxide dismutase [Fe] [Planctomycetota bacterium]HPF13388.1 Fe-Mn family superoxide dismutase [Planctomycetota bacterium]HRV80924.1 Fe-Mn family superoxide dismutase [Planctomycetota bacterium]